MGRLRLCRTTSEQTRGGAGYTARSHVQETETQPASVWFYPEELECPTPGPGTVGSVSRRGLAAFLGGGIPSDQRFYNRKSRLNPV